ncbi:MAG: hypothetical protein WCJ37_02960 [Syntrophus sp. (in: bacteria)]
MDTTFMEEKAFLLKIKPEASRDEVFQKLKTLNLTKEEKAALFQLSFQKRNVGPVVVRVGLWLVETIVNIAGRFPMTCAGAVVGLVIFFLLSSIWGIGSLLASLAAPIIALITMGLGLFNDLGFQVQTMVYETARRYR